jgi:hypothetical protein
LARRIYIHHEKGEHFTIDDLHKYAKEECEYICGRTKLYTILKSMGYRYRKHNNRLVLIAQPHIILKRIKFIRKYLQYLQSDNYIQGGPTLTIFAITRFLTIEKIFRLARKRHTLWSYKPVPLFYLLSIGFRVKRR